ncbi:MAG: hypothetical protein R3344_07670 [Acidobacteriota bacterium]|nr:hypothetical protein [Acidobacteriota bacterium]
MSKALCRCLLLGTAVAIVGLLAAPTYAVDCAVKIDRAIICGPGNVADVGFEPPGSEIIGSCMGTDGEELVVRYIVQNFGETELFNCQITDTNEGVDPQAIPIGTLLVGQRIGKNDPDQVCSDSLEAGEPGTATITCDCIDSSAGEIIVTDTDTADFECGEGGGGGNPEMRVTKRCDPQSDGTNAVTVTVENAGGGTLNNCVVTDEIFLADDSCPADVGAPTFVGEQLIPVIGAGESVDVPFSVDGLVADACNRTTVMCRVGPGGPVVTKKADDLCEVPGGGCFSRTPGFWGNHLQITAQFLPVVSCGITVDQTDPRTEWSVTEDLCKNSNDARRNDTSNQQLSLIRACTAAALNLKVTGLNDGNCESEFAGIGDLMEHCCTDICNGGYDGNFISETGCIGAIDAFNNMFDTLDTPDLFISPGPADPTDCKRARGNGWVNPDRDLGPPQGGPHVITPPTTQETIQTDETSSSFGGN